MVFELYSSKTTDASGLPKSVFTTSSLIGLINKIPAIVKGDFIGEFSSREEVNQFIEGEIERRQGKFISISNPENEKWISADFQTMDGEMNNLNYFLLEKNS